MNHQELYERLCRFADAVAKFAEPLFKRKETDEAADQLTRAAASGAANYRASHYGRSNDEFRSNLTVGLTETDEARHWLTHLRDTGRAIGPELDRLLDEAQQLTRILGASSRTANRNARARAAEADARRRPHRRPPRRP